MSKRAQELPDGNVTFGSWGSGRWDGWTNTKLVSEFFGHSNDSLEVECSRYRFALADRPDMAARWAAVQREYRQIQAAREALASE